MLNVCTKNPVWIGLFITYICRGAALVVPYKTKCECCISGRWLCIVLVAGLVPTAIFKYMLIFFAIVFGLVGKADFDYYQRKRVYEDK